MCVQNQKSIALFPSSTNLYKFRHDGSVVCCFIVKSISFKVLWSVYTQCFVKHCMAAWPFTTFAALPLNFSSSYITTTQSPSFMVLMGLGTN